MYLILLFLGCSSIVCLQHILSFYLLRYSETDENEDEIVVARRSSNARAPVMMPSQAKVTSSRSKTFFRLEHSINLLGLLKTVRPWSRQRTKRREGFENLLRTAKRGELPEGATMRTIVDHWEYTLKKQRYRRLKDKVAR